MSFQAAKTVEEMLASIHKRVPSPSDPAGVGVGT